ncbi:Uncharacterized protein APZ42_001647 [Daphnia magna]|uniref:Uncharacterized protein n=1 Tax=Daphnia magna TaxID=35525 RepID=A0A164IUL9_9CRUS|nr:Uncharacterized protein APZ42_001647 [Daphnia magna]
MNRGCSAQKRQKVADKVAPKDRTSKNVFLKIAYKIPYLDDEALSEKELDADTKNCNAATEWVKWWTKPKNLKMFTKSFKDMTEADWQICPRTTNAVESHNKLSNARTTLFLAAFSTYYRVDKKSAYDSIAAELGVAVGPTKEQRRRNNKKRKIVTWRSRDIRMRHTPHSSHSWKQARANVRVRSTLLCLNVALATQDVCTFSNASGKQARANVLKRSALLCSKCIRVSSFVETSKGGLLVQPTFLSNKSYGLSRLFVETARAKALDDSTLLFAYHK